VRQLIGKSIHLNRSLFHDDIIPFKRNLLRGAFAFLTSCGFVGWRSS
jgi:hypothetical protein